MKVRTHNGCGIATGAVLCCDFGERYVAASAGDIQPAKRFRGALEVFFSEQAKVNAAASCLEPEGTGGISAPACTTGATAPVMPKVPAKVLEPAKVLAKPPRAPAKAGSATPAAVAATAAAAVVSGAAEAAASSSSALVLPGASSGPKCVLATSADWELAASGGKVILTNTTKQNKRVPPKTVLLMLSKGSVDDSPGGMNFPFSFQKPSEVVLTPAKAGSGYDTVTLKDVIKDTSAAALYQHGSFTKAVAPPTFVCKKVMNYNPHAEEKAACAVLGEGAAKGAWSDVVLRWVVAAQGGKIMPIGMALVCSKQIVLQAEQIKVL